MPEADGPGAHARDGPGPSGDRLGIAGLMTELQRVLAAMNRLISAMDGLASRPPLQLVAHQHVGQLEFHTGNIDVQTLSGELNLGITHKVDLPREAKSEEPTPESTENAPPAPTGASPTGAAPAGASRDGVRTLANSVVTRWREQGRPARDEARGEPPPSGPGSTATLPPPPPPPPDAQPESHMIWPPPSLREGGAT